MMENQLFHLMESLELVDLFAVLLVLGFFGLVSYEFAELLGRWRARRSA